MHRRVVSPVAAFLVFLIVLGAFPLPCFAIVLENDLIAGVPFTQRGILADQMVDIDAPSGYLMTRSGTVLWARAPEDNRSIASITKVMTAIITIEADRLEEEAVVSWEAATVGGSTASFEQGQVYTVRYLLYAMLIVSGNDAAVTLAEHIGGDESTFVAMMNKKATDLGLKHTHFTNPQGFDDEEHYSCAQDVATMVSYAMKLPLFREIVGTHQFDGIDGIPQENTNLLLTTFVGANGVKTGMTDAAGNCLAGSALRDEVEIYSVVLGTASEEERFQETRDLLTFGFEHYGRRLLMEAGTELGSVEVTDHLDTEVRVGLIDDVTAVYYDLVGPIEHTIDIAPISSPVTTSTVVGSITFTQNGEEIASEPLVSFEEVEKPTFFQSIKIALTRAWRWVSGGSRSSILLDTSE
ncbi:MAG: D-alanyl-D-alanine carboxypeptidase [Coriobacteriia bacterium]|nr:D-alanyl-D-alanine carboxypeptidase [Coriobacteriia bacterium]